LHEIVPALNARFNIARPHLFRHRLNRRHCSADASAEMNAMKERLMHFERQQVEHAIKLASIGEQVAAVDVKVEKLDNNLKYLATRFDTKFDSFQVQMYLAVRHTTHPTPRLSQQAQTVRRIFRPFVSVSRVVLIE
jgi:uncharacterized coiled-coil protein SlyX